MRIERSQAGMGQEIAAMTAKISTLTAELATANEALRLIVKLNDGTPAVGIARVALGLPDERAPEAEASSSAKPRPRKDDD